VNAGLSVFIFLNNNLHQHQRTYRDSSQSAKNYGTARNLFTLAFKLSRTDSNQGNVNRKTLFSSKKFKIIFEMSFQDGKNRPPRRQSAKNIDFRRLADVNNDDDDADDDFSVPKFCTICQKSLEENETELLVKSMGKLANSF